MSGSYFNTLNDFVENAKEANDHLDAIKDDLISQKVSDIRDRFNQHVSNVESFGQATLGASGGFHLGRKIYKTIKKKYGDDPAKDKDKKDKEGETDDEDDEPKTDEPSSTPPENEGLTSMNDENATEFQNPLFNKQELDSSENASGSPSESETNVGQNTKPTEGAETDLPKETEGGFKSNAAVESNETAERAQQVSDQADELGGKAQSLLERLQQATGAEGGGQADPIKESVDPEVSAEPSDVGVDVTKSVATDSVDVGEGAMDGFEAASQASRIAMKEAGGSITKNIAEKVGINLAEDAGSALLDAVPIVGEIAGVAQIFHGLFHEHKERLQERKKEGKAASKIAAGGEAIASGGLDLGSVLPQGAAVAGLV